MAYSKRYKTLESRVAELRKRFLPLSFSKSGVYTADKLDNARAYRVLVHAELEHYFEERAIDIATTAFNLWKIKSKPSVPLVFLVSNYTGTQQSLPKQLGTSVTILSIIGKVYGQYMHTIRNNNGIRTENLLQILLPIGILEPEIDPVWLSTTDGFGSKRGATAHSTAISYQIDPQDDFQTVKQIMQGVRDIDNLLSSLRKKLK